jgi:hypothetical protein
MHDKGRSVRFSGAAGTLQPKPESNTMKQTFLAALLGAGLTAAAFLAAPGTIPPRASAADAPAEESESAAANPTAVTRDGQYKILSLAPYQNDANVRRMEEAINALAAQGWKVKTGVGIALILER